MPEYKANIIFSFRHNLLGTKGRKSGASYKIIGSLFIWRAVNIKKALFIEMLAAATRVRRGAV